MSTLHRSTRADRTTAVTDHAESQLVTSGPVRQALAVLRIAFGLTFLWAFFDKLLALGFPPAYNAKARRRPVRSGRLDQRRQPHQGFLKFGADGPFKGFYHSIAGEAWVDWLFMLGLLGIGVALTFGSACGSPRRRRRCCT